MTAWFERLELVCATISLFSSGLGLEPGPGSVYYFERTLPSRLPRIVNSTLLGSRKSAAVRNSCSWRGKFRQFFCNFFKRRRREAASAAASDENGFKLALNWFETKKVSQDRGRSEKKKEGKKVRERGKKG